MASFIPLSANFTSLQPKLNLSLHSNFDLTPLQPREVWEEGGGGGVGGGGTLPFTYSARGCLYLGSRHKHSTRHLPSLPKATILACPTLWCNSKLSQRYQYGNAMVLLQLKINSLYIVFIITQCLIKSISSLNQLGDISTFKNSNKHISPIIIKVLVARNIA